MKHVVITGASRGLGKALAIGFKSRGWSVSCCATRPSPLHSLAEELGPDHLAKVCDVTNEGQVENFASEVLQRFGTPDLLLNNAAVINRNAPLWEVSTNEFSRLMEVNLTGVHRMIRAFIPAMIRSGKGVVVNFSSGWGRSVSPEVAPYCTSKWGIEGMTAALATELPAGLAAVALNPGIINTEMLQSTFGEGAGSYPDPDRWAEIAVPFLASLGPKDNGKPLTVPER